MTSAALRPAVRRADPDVAEVRVRLTQCELIVPPACLEAGTRITATAGGEERVSAVLHAGDVELRDAACRGGV